MVTNRLHDTFDDTSIVSEGKRAKKQLLSFKFQVISVFDLIH